MTDRTNALRLLNAMSRSDAAAVESALHKGLTKPVAFTAALADISLDVINAVAQLLGRTRAEILGAIETGEGTA
ncbi:MAG: hypothetical protein WA942_03195 [Mycolicibacter sinensis]